MSMQTITSLLFILLLNACTKSSIETVTETNPSKTNNSGGGEGGGGGSSTPLVALGSVLSNGFINASLSSSQDPLILVSDADNSTITFAIVSSTDTCSANSTFPLSTVPLISSLTVDGSYKVCAKVQDVMSTSPVILESAIINRDTLPPTISSITSQGPIADNVISGAEVSSTADLITASITGGVQVTYAVVSDGICSSATTATSTVIPTALSIPSNGSYQICVKAVDAAGNEAYQLSTGFTRSGNQTPSDLALSSSSLAENAGANYVIGNLSSTDADGSDTHTYTLVSGTGSTDNASFNINGSQLRATASFNFETKATYSIRLKTEDSGVGNLSFEKALTITVTDVNEAPTDISLSAASLAENNLANAIIGSLSTSDPDTANTHTYTLVSGTGADDNASFNIFGASLRVTSPLDFEVKNSFSVRIRSTDNGTGSLYFEESYAITVTDVNDTPSDIALSASSLAENNAVNASVGTLSTTDDDLGQSFTYTLVSGTGSDDNASFNISGSSLRASAAFNYEVKNSYTVRIRSTDNGTGSLYREEAFSISITNVNEAPTDLSLSASSILEGQTTGTVVGSLSSTDPDASDTFTYTLESGTGSTDNGSFSISGSNLLSGAVFVFATKSSYSIRVRTTDAGGLNVEKALTITITQASGGGGGAYTSIAGGCTGAANGGTNVYQAHAFGAGTAANPFRICTASQLVHMGQTYCTAATPCNGKYFLQMNDIPMSGPFKPVNLLEAHYDGNHNKISGLTVTNPVGLPASFISNLDQGSLKNIEFENLSLSHTSLDAALVGLSYDSTISNVQITGTSAITGAGLAGGLVASAGGAFGEETIIRFSSVSGDVTISSGGQGVGGLIGSVSGETIIEDSSASGTVNSASSSSWVGGLVGYNEKLLTITNSASYMDIRNVVSNANNFVGGIVGYAGDLNLVLGGLVSASKLPARLDVNNLAVEGGVIGRIYNGVDVAFTDEVYFDSDEAATSSALGAGSYAITTGAGLVYSRSTANMQTAGQVSGLSWKSHWYIDSGDDYPRLVKIKNGCVGAVQHETYTLYTDIGAGTVDDPYLLCNAAQFNSIGASGCNDSNPAHCTASFLLGKNIDMSGISLPNKAIAEGGYNHFSGEFDGQKHVIDGFTQSGSGLFASVSGAKITNLAVINIDISGSTSGVGSVAGTWFGGGLLRNVSTSGTILYNSMVGNGVVGGLVGSYSDTAQLKVLNCSSAVSIDFNHGTAFADRIGGLFGYASTVEVVDSYFNGTLKMGGNPWMGSISKIGGIVGQAENATLKQVYAKGYLRDIGDQSVTSIGGLIGAGSANTISNSYAEIIYDESEGNFMGWSSWGGLVGNTSDTVTYGYSASTVPANGSNMCGITNGSSASSTTYWDGTIASSVTSDTCGLYSQSQRKTTTLMKTQSTFSGWDFSNTWKAMPTPGVDYPRLKWEP